MTGPLSDWGFQRFYSLPFVSCPFPPMLTPSPMQLVDSVLVTVWFRWVALPMLLLAGLAVPAESLPGDWTGLWR